MWPSENLKTAPDESYGILGLCFMAIHRKIQCISRFMNQSDEKPENTDLPVARVPATGPCSLVFLRTMIPGAKTKLLMCSIT